MRAHAFTVRAGMEVLLAVLLLVAVFLLILTAVFLLILTAVFLLVVVVLHGGTSFRLFEYGSILAGNRKIIHLTRKNCG